MAGRVHEQGKCHRSSNCRIAELIDFLGLLQKCDGVFYCPKGETSFLKDRNLRSQGDSSGNEKKSDTESDTYKLAYIRSSCVPSERKDDEKRRGVTKKGGL